MLILILVFINSIGCFGSEFSSIHDVFQFNYNGNTSALDSWNIISYIEPYIETNCVVFDKIVADCLVISGQGTSMNKMYSTVGYTSMKVAYRISIPSNFTIFDRVYISYSCDESVINTGYVYNSFYTQNYFTDQNEFKLPNVCSNITNLKIFINAYISTQNISVYLESFKIFGKLIDRKFVSSYKPVPIFYDDMNWKIGDEVWFGVYIPRVLGGLFSQYCLEPTCIELQEHSELLSPHISVKNYRNIKLVFDINMNLYPGVIVDMNITSLHTGLNILVTCYDFRYTHNISISLFTNETKPVFKMGINFALDCPEGTDYITVLFQSDTEYFIYLYVDNVYIFGHETNYNNLLSMTPTMKTSIPTWYTMSRVPTLYTMEASSKLPSINPTTEPTYQTIDPISSTLLTKTRLPTISGIPSLSPSYITQSPTQSPSYIILLPIQLPSYITQPPTQSPSYIIQSPTQLPYLITVPPFQADSSNEGRGQITVIIVIIVCSLIGLGIIIWFLKGYREVQIETKLTNNMEMHIQDSNINMVSPSEYTGVYSSNSKVKLTPGKVQNVQKGANVDNENIDKFMLGDIKTKGNISYTTPKDVIEPINDGMHETPDRNETIKYETASSF